MTSLHSRWIICAMLMASSLCSCSCSRSPSAQPAATTSGATSGPSQPAKTPSPLEVWNAGEPDDAVTSLVNWAAGDIADLHALTAQISEQEFLDLPRTTQQATMERLLAENKALRQFVSSMIQQSRNATLAGDTDRARQIVAALAVLARVQQQPTLTRQSIMTGQAIEQAAQAELQRLNTKRGPG